MDLWAGEDASSMVGIPLAGILDTHILNGNGNFSPLPPCYNPRTNTTANHKVSISINLKKL